MGCCASRRIHEEMRRLAQERFPSDPPENELWSVTPEAGGEFQTSGSEGTKEGEEFEERVRQFLGVTQLKYKYCTPDTDDVKYLCQQQSVMIRDLARHHARAARQHRGTEFKDGQIDGSGRLKVSKLRSLPWRLEPDRLKGLNDEDEVQVAVEVAIAGKAVWEKLFQLEKFELVAHKPGPRRMQLKPPATQFHLVIVNKAPIRLNKIEKLLSKYRVLGEAFEDGRVGIAQVNHGSLLNVISQQGNVISQLRQRVAELEGCKGPA
mmetsp:Transcript_63314/g.117796  ORF Transcript_63314/g.117796 Transcript_63314/m.117796 type:complete len:264 (+) Transcript_63314:59-850(+)